MISVKTINNQNAVINSVLGLDQNSNTIINGKLNGFGRLVLENGNYYEG